ncbi:MAG: hypothetical protein HOG49_28720 [Candidatus Scalindua sp.]|jgi:hypothetical protein|nr:hypothetical protein [Candidatus Scalindua sp.]
MNDIKPLQQILKLTKADRVELSLRKNADGILEVRVFWFTPGEEMVSFSQHLNMASFVSEKLSMDYASRYSALANSERQKYNNK